MALSVLSKVNGLARLLGTQPPEQFYTENGAQQPVIVAPEQVTPAKMILIIVDLALFIYALFLSFRCKGKFNLGDFLFACCCSPCYVAYRLAVGC